MAEIVPRSLAQMKPIKPFFPRSHGVPRVDNRHVVSGIVFVIRNGLGWRDAPTAYGPHKTLFNRFIRWSRFGRLKDWRRIATRYDRCAHTFFSAITLAATVIFWLCQ
jgi:transposase